MISWYLLSLISLFLLGTGSFLFKVVAEKDYDIFYTNLAYMFSGFVIGFIVLFFKDMSINNLWLLLLIGLGNTIFFFLRTISNFKALKHVPANIFYPIFRSGLALTVILSTLIFHDQLTLANTIGIGLAILVGILLGRSEEKGDYKNPKLGIILSFIAAVAIAGANITSKLAVDLINIYPYVPLVYISAFAFTLASRSQLEGGKNKRGSLLFGLVIGAINSISYYSMLGALRDGPLSLVSTLIGMQFIIPIILSVIVYKEKMTLRRITAIVLAILATVLLRF